MVDSKTMTVRSWFCLFVFVTMFSDVCYDCDITGSWLQLLWWNFRKKKISQRQ